MRDGCHYGVILVGTVKMISELPKKLLRAFTALAQAGVCRDLVIQLNDSGMSFDEIADISISLHELSSIELVEY